MKNVGLKNLRNCTVAFGISNGEYAFLVSGEQTGFPLVIESWHVDFPNLLTVVDAQDDGDAPAFAQFFEFARLGSKSRPVVESLIDEFRGEMIESIADEDSDRDDLCSRMTARLTALVNAEVSA